MKNATRRLRGLAAGVAVATGLLLHAPVQAQVQQDAQGGRRWEQGQRQDPAQRLDRQVSMLTQRLQLSSTQASQVRGILQRQDEQLRAWRQEHRGELQRGGGRQGGEQPGANGERRRPELPAELKAIRDRGERQIEAVLNDRQRAEYRTLREQRGQWGGRRGG